MHTVCVCAHTAAVSLQGLKFADTPAKPCLWFKRLVLTHMAVDEHAEVNRNKVNTGMLYLKSHFQVGLFKWNNTENVHP